MFSPMIGGGSYDSSLSAGNSAASVASLGRTLACHLRAVVGHTLPWSCAPEWSIRWAIPIPRAAKSPGRKCGAGWRDTDTGLGRARFVPRTDEIQFEFFRHRHGPPPEIPFPPRGPGHGELPTR